MKKALTIGINYIHVPNTSLRGCIDDIENMTEILVQQYGFLNENVVQLRDDSNQPSAQPTRSNILRELIKIVEESDKCSEIWIHYSGHGSQIRDTLSEKPDGLDEVIVPVDFNQSGFIADIEIFDIIKNTKCKTMLVFDSCHSATVCNLQWGFEFNGNNFIRKQTANKTISNPNVFCMSGCKDSQTSADTYSAELKEPVGAFTDAILHCLKMNGYNVNVLKLIADVTTYIKNEGYTQTPYLSCSGGFPSSYLFLKTVPGTFTGGVIETALNPNTQNNITIIPLPTPSSSPTPPIKMELNISPITPPVKMGLVSLSAPTAPVAPHPQPPTGTNVIKLTVPFFAPANASRPRPPMGNMLGRL